jgi:protein-tyrosine phosphatase
VIDVHSHLLPGVDDGSSSAALSQRVLERFARDGVQVVVCTPHLKASSVHSAPDGEHQRIFDALVPLAPPSLALARGWEIMLDEPGVDLRAPHLALGGSSAVLVEFPRGVLPLSSAAELFRLSMSGLVPVLAHPERYAGCTVERVREWRSAGAVMQIDATTLMGEGTRARLARQLLAEGLVDLLASDNHGDARSLAPVRTWLGEHGAAAAATLLTTTNPERLLRNEPVLPVGPVTVGRGMLARLRALLRGRP